MRQRNIFRQVKYKIYMRYLDKHFSARREAGKGETPIIIWLYDEALQGNFESAETLFHVISKFGGK
jgi:hypothetical protein